MTTPEQHQFKIAKDTLHLSDVGAFILGGMSKLEARAFLFNTAHWSLARIRKFEDA